MTGQPPFFEPIRQRAARRWEQLEQDAELAGPWYQLFKQVQSPRHVLSELLQNADDAGATEALVRIEEGIFAFEHNGEDFTEEHFASLCRFGYSNKRALHTIGFRGIGFKSIFSLGDRVELFTPSLSVCFDRQHFTEPHWLPEQADAGGRTRIQVEIGDRQRQREVEKNLDEWLRSPVSLLFFKNIRRMQIGDRKVHWGSQGPGPIPDSEWMVPYEKEGDALLLVRSEAEAFPEEALAEIRQERMLGTEEETEFPPCKVEIVLGSMGRLYVVLPTGVETQMPFACNAPFIQDPARLKIKDPETSPTNRWLLGRAGKLAASAMLRWLGQTETSLAERARAYGLFPDADQENSSLEGLCGTIVEEAFAEAIEGKPLLLTEGGQLVCGKKSVIIPKQILDVWSATQAAALLDSLGRPALCQHIESADRTKLLRRGVVDEIDKERLLEILRDKHLPKPQTWRQLMKLWAYVAPEIAGYRHKVATEDVRIVPVQGKDVLYAAREVVRLGEKQLLQSEGDWDFLADHLIVLNQNWPRFLAEQRRTSAEQVDWSPDTVEAAYAVLEEIGLDDTSDVNKVIDQVAGEFFTQDGVSLQGSVRLAQIAAKLGATVGDAFRYATSDEPLRSAEKNILFDEDGMLEELLPEQAREAHLLHPAYGASFCSCTREEWLKWVASGRSGLLTFIPLVQRRVRIYGKRQVEEEARKRGLERDLFYPYVTSQFVVEDWDFEDRFWHHWKSLAADDDHVWGKVVDRILSQRDAYWIRAKSARLLHVATSGNTRSMTNESLLPAWVIRLRDLPCLPDSRGFHHKPGDLLRRTPETESLMDVEPFVHGLLDCESTRPLLDLLGVRNTPTGPDRLLDCLRALAKAENPPVREVEKWYRRLDQMIETCSTSDFQKIKQAFRSEKLILTHDGAWSRSPTVFLLSSEEDVPNAAVIPPSVSGLSIWRKIDVAERPTAALAIEWLKALPSGKVLAQDDARRVRALLMRYPVRIWEECGHWLNLASEWVLVADLSYALTMQSLTPWKHLHQWVKQKTADLQRLSAEIASSPPFSQLPPLAGHVEERFHQDLMFTGQTVKKEWLTILGIELRRVELDTDDDTQHVRSLADTLARTTWRETPGLEIIPYIDGTPAGTPRQADVVWLHQVLYVDRLSKAKLARRVPEEIGKAFGRSDIKAALDFSFDRSADDVREYLEENFTLAALDEPVEKELRASGDDPLDHAPSDSTNEATAPPPQASDAERTHETDLAIRNFEIPGGGEVSTGDQPVLEAAEVSPRPRPKPKLPQPSLFEVFAKAGGFQRDGTDRFFHPDGSWIGRSAGSPFPWENHTASGELVRCYRPITRCLEQEPLELEADVWALLERRPETYALILSRPDGSPVEVSGLQLRIMRDKGVVTLYPARYRVVHESREEHRDA